MLKEILLKNRELILYGIIGGSCAFLDFVIFSAFVHIGINYLISNSIGVICGIVTSFFLNRKYNFKVTDKTERRFLLFFLVGLFGLMLSSLILYICVKQLDWNDFYAKILTIGIVSLIQFIINKTVTFKSDN